MVILHDFSFLEYGMLPATVRLILTLTILFYSILQMFYSFLFYSILYFLFCILFYLAGKFSIMFYSVFYSIICSILFYTARHSIILFYSILFFYSVNPISQKILNFVNIFLLRSFQPFIELYVHNEINKS